MASNRHIQEAVRQLEIEEAFEKLHTTDPATIASQFTGKDIDNDKETSDLWLGVTALSGRAKERIAEELRDTHLSMKTDYFLELLRENGFVQVYHESFVTKEFGGSNDEFFIFFHEIDALLVIFDTWHGSVSDGNMYYFWESNYPCDENVNGWHGIPRGQSGGLLTTPNEKARFGQEMVPGPSGGFVLEGHCDVRQGLFSIIRQFHENGKFLNPWPKPAHIWFEHHGDKETHPILGKNLAEQTKEERKIEKDMCNEIAMKRWNALPDKVRKVCKFEPWIT